jgi:hypothetical protein
MLLRKVSFRIFGSNYLLYGFMVDIIKLTISLLHFYANTAHYLFFSWETTPTNFNQSYSTTSFPLPSRVTGSPVHKNSYPPFDFITYPENSKRFFFTGKPDTYLLVINKDCRPHVEQNNYILERNSKN